MGYYDELQPSDLSYKIVQEVKETQDAFIFSTLSNYAHETYHITVEKEELTKAIQLIQMAREYGPSIDERWETATAQTAALSKEYLRGYQEGRDSEHQKFMDILEEMKRNHE